MDGYKRPFRGSKVYVRKKGKEDKTLVNLYKESEFAKEESDSIDDDIDDFISESKPFDEESVPVKKSVKKAREKEREKAERNKSISKVIARTLFALVAIALLVFGGLWFFKPSSSEEIIGDASTEKAAADEIYYSPLTGLETKNKDIATAEAACIMIENSTDARPQSGLNAAGVVYEAIAEGGITRFMAIYKDELPAWVGPIRSARQTFVQLARPYNCGYVHVGGATNAVNTLNSSGYRNLDGGWVEGQYVFRTDDRYAPHNVYTDASHLKEWSNNKGWRESKFTGFKRIKPDTLIEPTERNATTITVIMAGDDSYNVRWTYNVGTNKYSRAHIAGGAHMDRAKNNQQSQITTDIVITMKTSTVARPQAKAGFYDHVVTGSGEAYVFQNGTVQKATWRRANDTDELKFFSDNNTEIELNRGHTWISIYNNTAGGSVSWKK